jgi:hypothetical protein
MGSTTLFLLSNWQLAVTIGLSVLILGAVAWLLKNAWVAIAGVAVLVGYFAYQDAWVKGAEACRAQVADAVAAERERQQSVANDVLEAARRRSEAREAEVRNLQAKVESYETATECVLDGDDARRLQDIR